MITVAAFYADVPGQPSRLDEYRPYIMASKRALELTNPGARFVVLTDYATSVDLQRDVEVAVVATEGLPLMLQIVAAQRDFAKNCCRSELLVLPDVDCLVNRDLGDVIEPYSGFAMTHRGPKFNYRINNLGFARDMSLAAWFLDRAYRILEGWPAEKHQWWGDQEAWGAAVGIPPEGLSSLDGFQLEPNGVLVGSADGRLIDIYPCATHNRPMRDNGVPRDAHRDAYFVHFKGPRKDHIAAWMRSRFGEPA